MTYTYVSENETRMSVDKTGLNTIYTNLDTQEAIHVRVQMTRLSQRKLLATRTIDGVAPPTTLFFIDTACGMRPHYGLKYAANKWDALASVQGDYSDRIVMSIFEERNDD